MDWLLKIVSGPMQGAEIALDAGHCVTFGRDAGCDIVIADAGLADNAFSLDVSADTVMLLVDGDSLALKPFEVHTFGTTGIAVGPASGTWEELRQPAPAPVAEEEPAAAAETAPEPAAEASADPTPAETEHPENAKSVRRVVLFVLIVLCLLLAVAAGILFFGPKSVRDWKDGILGNAQTTVVASAPSISEIARSNGLTCVQSNGVTCLSGNLGRRTERLAIRALALSADPKARLDLTDDETLAAAVEALLFTVSEDAVHVVKAENRRVVLTGALPTRKKLESVLRALSADVPGIDSVDASGVTIGRATVKAPSGEEQTVDEAGEVVAPRPRAVPARRTLPVAGILTTPYRCVVMQGGARCTEGAVIGKAKLVKIEAGCLTFEESGSTFEWRPGVE